MQLKAICRVLKYAPALIKLCLVVILDKIGDGGARILDLLVSIAVGCQDDGAVGLKGICAVRPSDNTSDTSRVGSCENLSMAT